MQHDKRMCIANFHRMWVTAAVGLLVSCAQAPQQTQPPEPAPEPAGPSFEELYADANLLASNGRYDEAAEKLTTILSSREDYLPALRLLASVYTAMGRKKDATDVWERISALEPDDPDASYEAGIAAAGKGDWQAVRDKIGPAVESGTAGKKHELLLGEAYLNLGRKRDAELHLGRAAGLERADYLLGTLYYNRGMRDRAQAMFEAVVKKNPNNAEAHLHLGWLHYSKGNKRSALRHYRKSVEIDPGGALAQLSLAALYEENKRTSEAIEHYTAALRLPGIPVQEKRKAYNSAARLLVSAGRFDDAVSLIRRGLGEFPRAGGLHFQWGELLLRRGDKQGARNRYKKAAADPTWKKIALKRLHSIR